VGSTATDWPAFGYLGRRQILDDADGVKLRFTDHFWNLGGVLEARIAPWWVSASIWPSEEDVMRWTALIATMMLVSCGGPTACGPLPSS
jgi:hypothetical protein